VTQALALRSVTGVVHVGRAVEQVRSNRTVEIHETLCGYCATERGGTLALAELAEVTCQRCCLSVLHTGPAVRRMFGKSEADRVRTVLALTAQDIPGAPPRRPRVGPRVFKVVSSATTGRLEVWPYRVVNRRTRSGVVWYSLKLDRPGAKGLVREHDQRGHDTPRAAVEAYLGDQAEEIRLARRACDAATTRYNQDRRQLDQYLIDNHGELHASEEEAEAEDEPEDQPQAPMAAHGEGQVGRHRDPQG
jgi:hypothetical protein